MRASALLLTLLTPASPALAETVLRMGHVLSRRADGRTQPRNPGCD